MSEMNDIIYGVHPVAEALKEASISDTLKAYKPQADAL